MKKPSLGKNKPFIPSTIKSPTAWKAFVTPSVIVPVAFVMLSLTLEKRPLNQPRSESEILPGIGVGTGSGSSSSPLSGGGLSGLGKKKHCLQDNQYLPNYHLKPLLDEKHKKYD